MTPTPRSKSESKRLAITGKEGQIKKPAIGMDGDSQPARSGGGEAILSQEGPPMPDDPMSLAELMVLSRLRTGIKYETDGAMDMPDYIFSGGIKKMAQEILSRRWVLELDEKRRAALEKLAESFSKWNKLKARYDGWEEEADRLRLVTDLGDAWIMVGRAHEELDALTPTKEGDGLSWEKNQPDGLKED